MKLNLKLLRIENRLAVRGTTIEEIKESLRLEELTDEEAQKHGFHRITDEMRPHMIREVNNYQERHTHYKRVLEDTKFYFYNPDTITLTIILVDGGNYWQYGKNQVNEYILRDLGEYVGGLDDIDIYNFNSTSKLLGDAGADVEVHVGNKQFIGWLTAPTALIDNELPPKISSYFKQPDIALLDDTVFINKAMKEGNVTTLEILSAFNEVLDEYTEDIFELEGRAGNHYYDRYEGNEYDEYEDEDEYSIYGDGCSDCDGDCYDCDEYDGYDEEEDW